MTKLASSLSDLKEIGCKSIWPDHISLAAFSANRTTIGLPQNLPSTPSFRFDSLSQTAASTPEVANGLN